MRALLAICLTGGLALGACATPRTTGPAPRSGRLAHTVLIWLREGVPPERADAIVAEFTRVAQGFDGLEACTVGHARASLRPTVDASFDLAITMVFADEAAELAWQADADHHALVEGTRADIERLVVFDALE